jgi:hypothetical protein
MQITPTTRPVKREVIYQVIEAYEDELPRREILRLTILATLFNALNRKSDYVRGKRRGLH